MSAVLVDDRACHSVPGWHDAFLKTILPAVEAVARVRFRSLPAVEREESMAEAVATAMLFFVRLIERGKTPSAFAGRLAQVSVYRVMAGRLASCPDNSGDVLSRYARRRRGFTVERLPESAEAESDWEQVLVETGRCTPADIAISRIDFSAWLDGMPRRRRAIAEALGAGYRTDEVAEKFHLSSGRISQLRREFEDSWRAYQQQADECQAA
jgi:hypothetical protein